MSTAGNHKRTLPGGARCTDVGSGAGSSNANRVQLGTETTKTDRPLD